MKIIDLSHKINAGMPVYPGDEPVGMLIKKNIGDNGFLSYEIKTGMHSGTHIDMPAHFIENCPLASGYNPALFMGKAALLNAVGENVVLMKREYEKQVEDGGIAVIQTGWDKKFYSREYFSSHPVLSDEITDFLLSKKIRLLGLDTPSPDLPDFTIHRKFLNAGVFIVENLCNLDKLEGNSFFELITLPLAIDAEASPVRAVGRIL